MSTELVTEDRTVQNCISDYRGIEKKSLLCYAIWGYGSIFGSAAMLVAVLITMAKYSDVSSLTVALVAILPIIGILLHVLYRPIANNKAQLKSMLEEILLAEDVGAAPLIISRLQDPLDSALLPSIQTALMRILPKIPSTGIDLLSFQDRNNLCFELKPFISKVPPTSAIHGKAKYESEVRVAGDRARKEFQLVIVELFERIGTKDEIYALERLSKQRIISQMDQHVADASLKAIDTIRKRLVTKSVSDKLLRASTSNLVIGDALLRPAGNAHVDEEVLLRPVEIISDVKETNS